MAPGNIFNIYYSGSDLPNNIPTNHVRFLFSNGTLKDFIVPFGHENIIKLTASTLPPYYTPMVVSGGPRRTSEAMDLLRQRRRRPAASVIG